MLHLSLILTHACNLSCSYCYMGEHHAGAMTADVARRAVELGFAESEALRVAFFGGEPLLAWDLLVETATFARRRAAERGGSVTFQVTTNGTLVDRPRAAILRDLGVRVALSLDGTAPAHDVARRDPRGAPSSPRALAGAAALAAEGVPFDVIAVVTPESAPSLVESVRFLDSLGPTSIVLNPAWEAPWTEAHLPIWREQLAGLAALWEERFLAGSRLPLPLFEGKLAAAARGARGAECSVGRWSVAVAPSGRLYPCDRLVADDRDARWVVGHLDEGFAARRRIPRGHADPGCEPCAERYRCNASCACANIAETGQSDHAGGVQCWYEQAVIELADAAGWRLLGAGHEGFAEAVYGGVTEAASGRAVSDKLTARVALSRRLPVLP